MMSKALKNLKPNDPVDEKYFDEIVDILWKNRKLIYNMIQDEDDGVDFETVLYTLIPKKILNNISGDFFDALCEGNHNLVCVMADGDKCTQSIKDEFARDCARYLYCN